MEEPVYSSIASLNYENLSKRLPHEDWSPEDYYIHIQSLIGSGQKKQAKKALKKHSLFLKPSGYEELIGVTMTGSKTKYQASDFIRLISVLDNRKHSPYMQGQLYLQISRYCAQEKMPKYAILFAEKAKHYFEKINLPYFVYLAEFNALISKLFSGEDTHFLDFHRHVVKSYSHIPAKPKSIMLLYQSVFSMYLGLYDLAEKILKEAIEVGPEQQHKVRYTGYLLYTTIKNGSYNEKLLPLEINKNNLNSPLTEILVKLRDPQFVENISYGEIKSWKRKISPLQVVMLADVLLSHHLETGNIQQLRETYRFINKEVILRDAILPVRNLDFYGALLGESKSIRKNYEHHLELIQSKPLSQEYILWNSRLNHKDKVLKFDRESNQIVYQNQIIDSSKQEKAHKLISTLAESSKGVAVEGLKFLIYENAEGASKSLDSLIYRLRKKFGSKFILRKENLVSLDPSIILNTSEETQHRLNIRKRQKMLLERIIAHGNWTSLGELLLQNNGSTRTLQEDLKTLLKLEKIEKKGKNKGTRYRARKA